MVQIPGQQSFFGIKILYRPFTYIYFGPAHVRSLTCSCAEYTCEGIIYHLYRPYCRLLGFWILGTPILFLNLKCQSFKPNSQPSPPTLIAIHNLINGLCFFCCHNVGGNFFCTIQKITYEPFLYLTILQGGLALENKTILPSH